MQTVQSLSVVFFLTFVRLIYVFFVISSFCVSSIPHKNPHHKNYECTEIHRILCYFFSSYFKILCLIKKCCWFLLAWGNFFCLKLFKISKNTEKKISRPFSIQFSIHFWLWFSLYTCFWFFAFPNAGAGPNNCPYFDRNIKHVKKSQNMFKPI